MVFYVIYLLFLAAYILCPESDNTPNDDGADNKNIGPLYLQGSDKMRGIKFVGSHLDQYCGDQETLHGNRAVSISCVIL
jgi:hypothetical protein